MSIKLINQILTRLDFITRQVDKHLIWHGEMEKRLFVTFWFIVTPIWGALAILLVTWLWRLLITTGGV